jgi:hypothetical protein
MKLQVLRIADRGVPNNERVHLSVLQEATLSFYVVLLTRYVAPSSVANSSLSAFWFPTAQVKPGDQVILFTGSGKSNSRIEANGSTTHSYYWGLKNAVFSDASYCIVLLEGTTWFTSPPGG